MSDVTQVSIMSRTVFTYGTVTLFGEPFQDSSINDSVFDSSPLKGDGSYNPRLLAKMGLGCCAFARHY